LTDSPILKHTYCKQIIVERRFGKDAELLFALLGKLHFQIAKPLQLKEKINEKDSIIFDRIPFSRHFSQRSNRHCR
jgi:hypothetical protein